MHRSSCSGAGIRDSRRGQTLSIPSCIRKTDCARLSPSGGVIELHAIHHLPPKYASAGKNFAGARIVGRRKTCFLPSISANYHTPTLQNHGFNIGLHTHAVQMDLTFVRPYGRLHIRMLSARGRCGGSHTSPRPRSGPCCTASGADVLHTASRTCASPRRTRGCPSRGSPPPG